MEFSSDLIAMFFGILLGWLIGIAPSLLGRRKR